MATRCSEFAMPSQISSANDMRLARREAVHPDMRHESPSSVKDRNEVDVTNMLRIASFMPMDVSEVWIQRWEVNREVFCFVLQNPTQLQE